jgi:phospholipid transport system substrate-binding protein
MLTRKIQLLCVGFVTSILLATSVLATTDPVAFLRLVTDRIMEALEKNLDEIKRNDAKLYSIVDHLILPNVDFNEMAQWVAGRNAWQKAPEDLRIKFTNKLQNLVVKTYAKALRNYVGQQIEFKPIRGSAQQKRILVLSLIKQINKPPIRLDYRLINENGEWKVYDLVIEGVSLLKGYQAQFSDTIQQRGLGAAIEQIDRHLSKTK